jgi:hypothetical protein
MLTHPAKTSSAWGLSTLFQACLATSVLVIMACTHYAMELNILGWVIITIMQSMEVTRWGENWMQILIILMIYLNAYPM